PAAAPRVPPPAPAQGRPAGVGDPPRDPALCGRGGLMPVSGLPRQLPTIALGAAARYGFALAGGNALIAHGVVNRFTADVDLFTDEEASVAAAAEAVEAALTAAGFQAERRGKTRGRGGSFPPTPAGAGRRGRPPPPPPG